MRCVRWPLCTSPRSRLRSWSWPPRQTRSVSMKAKEIMPVPGGKSPRSRPRSESHDVVGALPDRIAAVHHQLGFPLNQIVVEAAVIRHDDDAVVTAQVVGRDLLGATGGGIDAQLRRKRIGVRDLRPLLFQQPDDV